MSRTGGRAERRSSAGTAASRWLLAPSVALIVITAWTSPAMADSPLAWSSSAVIDHLPPFQYTEAMRDASCPSPSFCAAIDDGGKVLTSTDPTGGARAWKPTKLANGRPLSDISCPSVALCVIPESGSPQEDGGPAGVAISTRPAAHREAWSFTPLAGQRDYMAGVSCPSPSLCFAVGGTEVFSSRDPTGGQDAWKTTTIAPPRDGLASISCPSAHLCVIVDSDGQIFTSSDPTGPAGAWKATAAPAGENLLDISCPSDDLCVVPQVRGTYPDFEWSVLTSTDPTGDEGAWTQTDLDDSQQFSDVFCPSETLCVGTAFPSTLVTSTDPTGGASAWTPASLGTSGYVSRATCASDSFCLAVGSDGAAASSTDPTGGAGAWTAHAIDGYSAIYDISCPSESFCVAEDGAGKVLTSNAPSVRPGAWRAAQIDKPNQVFGLSCPSARFCAALDSDGNVLTSTRPTGGSGAWQATHVGDFGQLDCPSRSLCVATSYDGHIAASADPTGGPGAWHVHQLGDVGQAYNNTVSCPSETLCLVASTVSLGAFAGTAPRIDVSTNPTADDPVWTGRTFTRAGGYAAGISCASTSFCMIAGGPGALTSTTPADLDAPWRFVYSKLGHGVGGGDLDCPSEAFCAALQAARKIGTTTRPLGGAHAWRSTPLDFSARTENPYPTANALRAVSCPSSSMCVVSDSLGELVVGRAKPPGTKITGAKVRQHAKKAHFTFESTRYLATGFQCKLKRRGSHHRGRGGYRRCRSPKAYRHLALGRYVFKVRARNAGGPDPTPPHRSFRIPRR